MATTIQKYTSYNQYIHSGEINLNDTGNIKLALVTSGYVYSAAHTIFDNGGNNNTDPSYSELTTGDGYTSGGAALTSLSVDTIKFDAANTEWTVFTGVFRGGILYHDATYKTIVRPLIAYILFDDTPANITVSTGTFTVAWHVSGIITFA